MSPISVGMVPERRLPVKTKFVRFWSPDIWGGMKPTEAAFHPKEMMFPSLLQSRPGHMGGRQASSALIADQFVGTGLIDAMIAWMAAVSHTDREKI